VISLILENQSAHEYCKLIHSSLHGNARGCGCPWTDYFQVAYGSVGKIPKDKLTQKPFSDYQNLAHPFIIIQYGRDWSPPNNKSFNIVDAFFLSPQAFLPASIVSGFIRFSNSLILMKGFAAT